jgi:PAS domain S-box-containing protein
MPWTPTNGTFLSNGIFSLLAGVDGSLWIGTGANLVRLKDGNLTNYQDAPGRINTILQDHNGTVWIARSRVHDEKGPLCEVADTKLRCYGKANGIAPPYAGPLVDDNEGNLWIGSPNVLTRWKADSSTTFAPPGLKGAAGLSGVQALAATQDGSVWSGTNRRGPGLGLQKLAQGVWKPLVTPELNGERLEVSALFVDHENSLWIGTVDQGIYRVHDGRADRFFSGDGLSSDSVSAFYEDREGNMWVATSEGIDCFRNIPVITFSSREGLSANFVHSVLAARDGTVWIGNHGALDSLRGSSVSSIRAGKGFPGERVTSLLEDHGGRLWVGIDDGLYIYEKKRFDQIRGPEGSPIGAVIALTEDRENSVWAEVIGTPAKLVRVQDREVREEIPAPRMPAAGSLAADPKDGVWLGLVSGDLARYRRGQLEVFPAKHPQNSAVLQLLARSDGSVLAATPAGLMIWRNGILRTLTLRNGLPCDTLYGLVLDAEDALWLYAQCGLVKVPSKNLQEWWDDPRTMVKVETFDVFDGARPWSAAFQPHASRSPDGRLWFANENVAQMIDPGHLSRNTVLPPVHVEEIIADHKSYAPRDGLRLPALTRDLEIAYTALSFVAPQKVHFRYKLEGKDSEWQDPGTRRQAFYADLRPGKYRFRVMGCNNDGVWNEEGATLAFSLAAAWYQTWWFRWGCLAAFLALLWALYQLRIQQLQRQEKQLRDVIDTVPTLAFSTSPDGMSEWVNRRWVEYSGLSAEATSGAGWRSTVHPDDLDEHVKKWQRSHASGEPFENEARHRSANGEYRWFLVRAVPLRDAHGNILKWYGTLTDVEDRKKVEQERERLRQLEADLAHVNRVSTLGELAASLSHELRQPIAAAITDAKTCLRWLAREQPDMEEAREATMRVVKDGNRAAEIIERLRSFYKKGAPLERELVDVNEVVREMLDLLRSEANRYSICMRTYLAAELPKVTADRVQLQQVLMNLMLNGIEAMKDTGGELTIKSERGENGELLMSISDCGVGLPTEKADEIFEAFFTTKPQGSGMGLTISRSIIKSHGGRLWAGANANRGVTFYFTLPSERTHSRSTA